MKSLEILDISRNKIRKMPDNFGTLISLKVKITFNVYLCAYSMLLRHKMNVHLNLFQIYLYNRD
jgi:hypothetical protein